MAEPGYEGNRPSDWGGFASTVVPAPVPDLLTQEATTRAAADAALTAALAALTERVEDLEAIVNPPP